MRAPRWLKWTAIAVLTTVGCLVLVTGTIVGTESGRLWLVERATNFAANAGVTLEFHGLRTPELGTWRAERLRVSRQNALLLELRQFELIWLPSALLDRQLAIKRLAAAQVAYHQPQTSASPESPESSAGPNPPPVQILVDALQVDQLSLHNLTTKPLPDYRVSGSLDAFGPTYPLHLQLEIASLEPGDMLLKIDTQAISERAVRIQGQLRERAGGLLGSLARWPADQALEAQFGADVEQNEQLLSVALEELRLPLSGHTLTAQGNISYAGDSKTLTVHELVILTGEHHQKLRGGYSPLDMWAEVDLDHLPLELLSPWVEDLQSGSVSGIAELNWLHQEEGRWPNVTADANIQVTYRQQTLTASVNGRLENKVLSLQPSSAQLEQTELQASGVVDLESTGSDLQGTISKLDTRLLKNWSVPIPDGLQATSPQTTFSVRGSLQNPLIKVNTQVDGHYQERQFSLTVGAEGSRTSARFSQAHLISGDSEVQVKGLLDWTGNTTNLQVNMENLTQNLLKLAPESVTEAVPEDLSFDASGALQVSGPLRKPQVKVQGLVTGAYAVPAETLPYRLTLDGSVQVGTLQELRLAVQRLELQVFDTPTLVVEGRYEPAGMDLHLRMDSLPTRMLAALGWHKVDGEAEADVRLQGSLQKPLIQGFFEYRDQLPGRGGRVPVAIHAEMTTEDDDFIMLTTIKHNQEPAGNLTVSLPLGSYLQSQGQQDVPLNLDAQGVWDLRFLRLFVDPVDHRVDGKLGADFTVRGTLQQPVFLGELKLTEGTYSNAVTGTQLEDITLTLQGSGQSVLVKDARARSGDDGHLTLAGEIHWAEQRRQARDAITLMLEAHNAMILQRRDLQGEIQGQLKVEGSFEELWVTGEMEIAPLNASVESAMSNSIPEIKVTEVTDEEPDPATSSVPTINLDITLIADRQAYLRGRGLDTELSGRIRVQGTASDPQYRGTFTTRRGHIELFGKRFVLQNGEVRFNNDGVILRIPAVYTTSDIEIRAELYGTADEPKLKLTSIPSRPEDEILALLIFGKPIDQITAFEAIRLAAAVRSLSSGGGFDPVDSARQMLGVDALTIDNSTSETGSGVSVGVGKYLSEKVYLELKRTPNPTQPWQGSVQVELTPKLTLQSGTSEDGGGGAELFWKRDY
jgi:translocation and assembly module TamB